MAATTVAALRMPGPLSPRVASYRIEASLDADKHTVTGHERLTWKNTTATQVRTLTFHLYMNAFKNQSSTFFKESKGLHRFTAADKHGWGAIDVTKIVVAGGEDLTRKWRVDDTLATVELAAPVAAGATLELDLDWKTVLPKVFARAGYNEDFFAIAQWFPKIGVWDCAAPEGCRWRAHQHHLNSEFFADYGVYDVSIDVPAPYQVGATGVLVGETSKAPRKTLRFHAEDVHDFVIVACPRFRAYEETYTDAHGQVKLVLLSIPGHEANAARHLAATRVGLDELLRRFGPYPYSQLTIVDVPEGAEGAGGMEYPTLFFTFDAPVPRAAHLPELVTIHELSHQYFYGLVGSDEVEEAWLDEGLTETMTDWGLSRMFGRAGATYDLLGHRMALVELNRARYRRFADVDPVATRAFQFLDPSTYGAVTYAKTNLVLRTLEGLLGPETFERGMRHYYETWRFLHPRKDDFVRAFDEGAKQDLSWFWTPALSTTQVLDYEVLTLASHRQPRPAGLFELDGGIREVEVPAAEAKKAPYLSEVVVHRKGDFVFPVQLKVVFEDGRETRETWDGGKDGVRWKRFNYEGDKKLAWAQVDPEDRIPLDVRRWNNGRTESPEGGPRRRLVGAWELAVSTVLSWVGF